MKKVKNVVTFHQFKGQKIGFKFNSPNKMVNASQMAKPFGKEPYSFLRNKSTQDYICALGRSANLRSEEIVLRKNGGKEYGTWMNELLAVKFAGWLNPEFEVWMTKKIRELLLTGKTEIPNHPNTKTTVTDTTKTAERVGQLHDLIQKNVNRWNKQDAKELQQLRAQLDQSIQFNKKSYQVLKQFFGEKGHEHFIFADAVYGYSQFQPAVNNFGLAVKTYYDQEGQEISVQDARDFIIFMRDMNAAFLRMSKSTALLKMVA